jgi:hypothetical protein
MTSECKRLLTFEARRNQISLLGRWPTTSSHDFSVLEEPQCDRLWVSTVVSGLMKTESRDRSRYFFGRWRHFSGFLTYFAL